MERVQGIGGLFFKAIDKPALLAWYRDNLGIDVQDWGGAVFNWREMNPTGDATTHWPVSLGQPDGSLPSLSQARTQ